MTDRQREILAEIAQLKAEDDARRRRRTSVLDSVMEELRKIPGCVEDHGVEFERDLSALGLNATLRKYESAGMIRVNRCLPVRRDER